MRRLGRIIENLKILLELAREVLLEDELNFKLDDINLDLEPKDVSFDQSNNEKFLDPDEDEFELEQIRDFIEEYVGLVIVNFSRYNDNVGDIKKDLVGRLLTKVSVLKNSIELEISSLAGVKIGTAKIIPTLSGQFAEKNLSDFPVKFSRYRISFYGGDAIEYLDKKNVGNIEFLSNRKE